MYRRPALSQSGHYVNLGGFHRPAAQDVITELTKIRRLRSFPRSAVLAYRDKPVTAPEIGQRLNTAYLLDGSLCSLAIAFCWRAANSQLAIAPHQHYIPDCCWEIEIDLCQLWQIAYAPAYFLRLCLPDQHLSLHRFNQSQYYFEQS